MYAPRELALLALAARQADDVAALEVALAAGGVIVAGSKGQARLNGVVTELRQGRIALAKLLGDLALPGEDDGVARTAKSERAQRAANTRWARERQLRGSGDGAVGRRPAVRVAAPAPPVELVRKWVEDWVGPDERPPADWRGEFSWAVLAALQRRKAARRGWLAEHAPEATVAERCALIAEGYPTMEAQRERAPGSTAPTRGR